MSIRNNLLAKVTRAPLERFIAQNASTGRTLEIGGARPYYASYFPNRVGFDIQSSPSVDVVGDAHTLPFKNEEFDTVVCVEVLEHLHTPQVAIDEMRRVLRKGGTLLLTTRFIQAIHDAPGDYYRFTKYGLAHLLRAWQEVEITEDMTTAQTFGALLQRLAYQCDLRGGTLTKLCLLVVARCTAPLGWVIRREYGKKNDTGVRPESSIMTSGYHVRARK
jgi:SAM-dependent methyltransferase